MSPEAACPWPGEEHLFREAVLIVSSGTAVVRCEARHSHGRSEYRKAQEFRHGIRWALQAIGGTRHGATQRKESVVEHAAAVWGGARRRRCPPDAPDSVSVAYWAPYSPGSVVRSVSFFSLPDVEGMAARLCSIIMASVPCAPRPARAARARGTRRVCCSWEKSAIIIAICH